MCSIPDLIISAPIAQLVTLFVVRRSLVCMQQGVPYSIALAIERCQGWVPSTSLEKASTRGKPREYIENKEDLILNI